MDEPAAVNAHVEKKMRGKSERLHVLYPSGIPEQGRNNRACSAATRLYAHNRTARIILAVLSCLGAG